MPVLCDFLRAEADPQPRAKSRKSASALVQGAAEGLRAEVCGVFWPPRGQRSAVWERSSRENDVLAG